MEPRDAPSLLTEADILVPVRGLFGTTITSIPQWTASRITEGAGLSNVWRLTGTARDVTDRSWSLILKGWEPPGPGAAPTGVYWPRREFDLYDSGLLSHLPGGIRSPVMLGSLVHDDGFLGIWMEDVTTSVDDHWSLDEYQRVAKLLGRFNGGYLTGVPLPEHRSLSRGWLQQWIEMAGSSLRELLENAGHPLVHRVYPERVIAVMKNDWQHRDALYDRLRRSPHVFCHQDAFTRNVLFRDTPDGEPETILIDWEYAGIGAPGEDLAPVVGVGMLVSATPLEDAAWIMEAALDGYLEGLHEAGASVDAEGVRIVFEQALRLRYGLGLIRFWLPFLLDERRHPGFGRPIDDVVDSWSQFNAWLLNDGFR